ncbi:MAG: hypothetical protein QNJ61_04820 [Desulfobacterales bacterium]|nr:hypothetical protein [Desulfobacterales bacterium]
MEARVFQFQTDGGKMVEQRIVELGNRLKAIYKDQVGGNPEDLIRIWDDGVWYYVLRNDDTQSIFPVRYLAENREAEIAEALRQFKPVA